MRLQWKVKPILHDWTDVTCFAVCQDSSHAFPIRETLQIISPVLFQQCSVEDFLPLIKHTKQKPKFESLFLANLLFSGEFEIFSSKFASYFYRNLWLSNFRAYPTLFPQSCKKTLQMYVHHHVVSDPVLSLSRTLGPADLRVQILCLPAGINRHQIWLLLFTRCSVLCFSRVELQEPTLLEEKKKKKQLENLWWQQLLQPDIKMYMQLTTAAAQGQRHYYFL